MAELSEGILELLSMGPSSFAAIYGFLVRNGAVSRDVDIVWNAIVELERQDSLRIYETSANGESRLSNVVGRSSQIEQYRAWLGHLDAPELSVDAVSFDPIGIWCQAMATFPERLASDVVESWTLDCNEAQSTVTIQAATETIALQVLEEWLEHDGDGKLLKQRRIESIGGFRTRNGVEVQPAVRLSADFERLGFGLGAPVRRRPS